LSNTRSIKPSDQAKSGRSIVDEFGKAITLTDKGQVPFALTSKVEIALEGRTLLQTEFADQESRYRAGDFDIGAGKDAEKSGRSWHERETEAIRVSRCGENVRQAEPAPDPPDLGVPGRPLVCAIYL
jgi:hypothetical protein